MILVNSEMPKGTEWQEVFDTFIAGDIQDFARYCSDPGFALRTEMATPKKRKVATPRSVDLSNAYPTPSPTPTRKRPRISNVDVPTTPTKRRTPGDKSKQGGWNGLATPQSLKEKGEYVPPEIPPSPISG